MLNRILFAIFIALLSSACSAQEKNNLPDGWRLPTKQELNQDWRKISKSDFALVVGDFDGNGIIDSARQLLDSQGKNYAVFASLNQSDGFYIHLLLEKDQIAALKVMGLEKVEPGKYKTACGKGYFECGTDELEEIIIKNDAINYFKVESANSFYYWDGRTSSFKKIWISD